MWEIATCLFWHIALDNQRTQHTGINPHWQINETAYRKTRVTTGEAVLPISSEVSQGASHHGGRSETEVNI